MSDALTRMRISLNDQGLDPGRAESLLQWAQAFLIHCDHREPEELGLGDVKAFLEQMEKEKHAGQPTKLRMLEAVEHLFRQSERGVPGWLRVLIEEESRDKTTPNVLSYEQITKLLGRLNGPDWLAAALVYGAGLRLAECVRLRVRDFDLDNETITVRDADDRVTRTLSMPGNIRKPLEDRLDQLRADHIRDIVQGYGFVTLPPLIAEAHPEYARKWLWQYLFVQRLQRPGEKKTDPPRTVLHHTDPDTLHEKFEQAAISAGIYRRVTGHVLRNTFAVHMLKRGIPLKRLETLLGTRNRADDNPGEDEDGNLTASLVIPPKAIPQRNLFH